VLKFERTGQEAIVSIRLRSRSSFFDRALLQALLWSFLFHLLLFGTFRIRYDSFIDTTPAMHPINVAIEHEPQEPMPGVSAIDDSGPIDPAALFLHSLDMADWKASCLEKLAPRATSLQGDLATPRLTSCALTQEELATSQKSIAYAPILYPLHLSCSRSLRSLEITEDGSSLFRSKTLHDDLGRLTLSKQSYPIEYKVKIEGATGMIIHWERKYELLDKELQKVADRLISKITFAPFAKRSAKGSITLTFCCNGEEIQELLR